MVQLKYATTVQRFFLQALSLLLDPSSSSELNGLAVNVTDGLPVSLRQFVAPMNLAMTGREVAEPFAVEGGLTGSVGRASVIGFARVTEAWLVVRERLTGRRARLPKWGLTPMEAYKAFEEYLFYVLLLLT